MNSITKNILINKKKIVFYLINIGHTHIFTNIIFNIMKNVNILWQYL